MPVVNIGHQILNTKLAIDAVADAVGLSVEEAIIKPQYTFLGYDPRS